MTSADQPLLFVLDLVNIRLIQGRNWQSPACQCLWCYITRHRRHGRCTSRRRTYCTRPQPPSSGHCVPSCSCHGLRWQLLNSRATRYATLAAMIDSCDTCLACARMSDVLCCAAIGRLIAWCCVRDQVVLIPAVHPAGAEAAFRCRVRCDSDAVDMQALAPVASVMTSTAVAAGTVASQLLAHMAETTAGSGHNGA